MTITIADPLELRIVEMINAERAEEGLRPVHTAVHLNTSAQRHSDWMANQGAFSHTGENGSSPSERAEDAGFPMQDASWTITENVSYTAISDFIGDDEIARMHIALMDSPWHMANILDADVNYIGVGLSRGKIESDGGDSRDVVFMTQNFGSSSEPVVVQEEVDGETVLTTFVDGEAVLGTSQPGPEADQHDDDDDAVSALDDEVPTEDDPEDAETASGGSCFVATAAYGSRLHPDVVTLRQFRDNVLVQYRVGRAFVRFYWVFGPILAKVVRPDHLTGRLVRGVLRPCVITARNLLCRRD